MCHRTFALRSQQVTTNRRSARSLVLNVMKDRKGVVTAFHISACPSLDPLLSLLIV